MMKFKILILSLFLSSFCYSQTIDDRGYLVKVGDKAPEFSLKLTDGKTVSLKNFRGKVVMLQFTASWCSVCRKEMPFIERDIWLKHKNNPDFVLLAIDRDEPIETVLKFANTIPISYPIGLDPNANIFALYAQREAGITRNVIIDKNGNIILLTRLYDDAEFIRMTTLLDSILK
jgi:peroxiredoxin